MLDQNIVDFTGHITGGYKKYAKFVVESFFDPMNDLDPEKKFLIYICFMKPVCVERLKNIDGCLSYDVMYFWIRKYLP